MPTVSYMLELSEDELTVIWASLAILDNKPSRHGDAQQRRLDVASKTALSKVQRLMEGK
jgi:hypothetical protein